MRDEEFEGFKKTLLEIIQKILTQDIFVRIQSGSSRRRFDYSLPSFRTYVYKGYRIHFKPIIKNNHFQADIEKEVYDCKYEMIMDSPFGNISVGHVQRRPMRTLTFFLKPYQPEEVIIYNLIERLSLETSPDLTVIHKENKDAPH